MPFESPRLSVERPSTSMMPSSEEEPSSLPFTSGPSSHQPSSMSSDRALSTADWPLRISAVGLQSSLSQPSSNPSGEPAVRVWLTSMPTEHSSVSDWPQQPSKSPSLSSWRTISPMPSFHPKSNPSEADWPITMPSEHPSVSNWPTSKRLSISIALLLLVASPRSILHSRIGPRHHSHHSNNSRVVSPR